MLPSFSKSALALVNRAFRLSAVAAAADRFLPLLPPLPFSLSSEDEEDPLPSSEILLTEDEADAEAEEAAAAAEEAVAALALSTSMEILFGLVMSESGSVFLLKRTSLSLFVVSNCWFMKRLAILETCPSFTAATTVVFAAAAGPLPPGRGNAHVTSDPKIAKSDQ